MPDLLSKFSLLQIKILKTIISLRDSTQIALKSGCNYLEAILSTVNNYLNNYGKIYTI